MIEGRVQTQHRTGRSGENSLLAGRTRRPVKQRKGVRARRGQCIQVAFRGQRPRPAHKHPPAGGGGGVHIYVQHHRNIAPEFSTYRSPGPALRSIGIQRRNNVAVVLTYYQAVLSAVVRKRKRIGRHGRQQCKFYDADRRGAWIK